VGSVKKKGRGACKWGQKQGRGTEKRRGRRHRRGFNKIDSISTNGRRQTAEKSKENELQTEN